MLCKQGQSWQLVSSNNRKGNDETHSTQSLLLYIICGLHTNFRKRGMKQARKPRSYASPKLRLTYRLTYLLTGVKCRATSVAKNNTTNTKLSLFLLMKIPLLVNLNLFWKGFIVSFGGQWLALVPAVSDRSWHSKISVNSESGNFSKQFWKNKHSSKYQSELILKLNICLHIEAKILVNLIKQFGETVHIYL